MKVFEKLFKTSRISRLEDDTLYKWAFIEKDELDKFQDAVQNIYLGKLDGLIVKSFFSPRELERMKNGIQSIPKKDFVTTPAVSNYPIIFAQLVGRKNQLSISDEELESYFINNENWSKRIDDILNVSFTKRLEKALSKLSNNSEVVIPSGYSQKGRHTHSTIRIYPPKGGFIAAHCGNYFQQEFPDFYKHLGSQIEVKNQLSYFVTIQKPEKGGELTLFDLLWEEGQTKVDPNEDNELILPGNQKLDITQNGSLKRRKIEPDAGDLLLFSGGRIWHRIEPIIGQIPRITLGGFLAYSEPTNKLFYWS